MSRCLWAAAIAWVAAAWPVLAGAHARSVSYSSWRIEPQGAVVTVRLSSLDLTALDPRRAAVTATDGTRSTPPPLADYVSQRLRLSQGGVVCQPLPGSWQRLTAASGWSRFEWRVRCPGEDGAMRLRSELFADILPAHTHFTRFEVNGGGIARERVLTNARPEVAVAVLGPVSPVTEGSDFGAFVRLGGEHILSGWDHLLFLLTLLLLAASLREVTALVTGFTVGHSLTLACAVFGFATPNTAGVESLIGLSILLVALENVWLVDARRGRLPFIGVAGVAVVALLAAITGSMPPTILAGMTLFAACYFLLLARAGRPRLVRWAIALLFGLIHGFAFAGVLRDTSLPVDRLAASLLGFNLGVELGQLGLVAVAWPVLLLWRRRGEAARSALVRWGSALALSAGTFWFVSRALAGG